MNRIPFLRYNQKDMDSLIALSLDYDTHYLKEHLPSLSSAGMHLMSDYAESGRDSKSVSKVRSKAVVRGEEDEEILLYAAMRDGVLR